MTRTERPFAPTLALPVPSTTTSCGPKTAEPVQGSTRTPWSQTVPLASLSLVTSLPSSGPPSAPRPAVARSGLGDGVTDDRPRVEVPGQAEVLLTAIFDACDFHVLSCEIFEKAKGLERTETT